MKRKKMQYNASMSLKYACDHEPSKDPRAVAEEKMMERSLASRMKVWIHIISIR